MKNGFHAGVDCFWPLPASPLSPTSQTHQKSLKSGDWSKNHSREFKTMSGPWAARLKNNTAFLEYYLLIHMVCSHVSIMVFECFWPIYRAYKHGDSPDSADSPDRRETVSGATDQTLLNTRRTPHQKCWPLPSKMYFSIVALNAFERIDPSPKWHKNIDSA